MYIVKCLQVYYPLKTYVDINSGPNIKLFSKVILLNMLIFIKTCNNLGQPMCLKVNKCTQIHTQWLWLLLVCGVYWICPLLVFNTLWAFGVASIKSSYIYLWFKEKCFVVQGSLKLFPWGYTWTLDFPALTSQVLRLWEFTFKFQIF